MIIDNITMWTDLPIDCLLRAAAQYRTHWRMLTHLRSQLSESEYGA